MTPAEIAAKLTPAQARALRLTMAGKWSDVLLNDIDPAERMIGKRDAEDTTFWLVSDKLRLTPLGRAVLAALPAANTSAQCCMCGKTGLSTVEGDGCTECELSDGRWVCSSDCWDKADPLTPTRVADSGGRETDSKPMKEVE
jgi:hypothetical protein